MADEIKQAGNDVIVVSMEANGFLVPEIRSKGIEVIELGVKGIFSVISSYFKLMKIVNRFKPDIIHAHMIHANLLSRIVKVFNPKIKLINTAHNINEGKLMKLYSLSKAIPEWSTNVSHEAYEYFLRNGYFVPDKSSFIYNAIDTDAFNMAPGTDIPDIEIDRKDFIFLFAGRLHYQKNLPVLFKAFDRLIKEGAKAMLIIAGDGELKPVLADLAEELNITERVRFIGKRNDLPQVMKLANCFVLSSAFEGFGLVVGEAMASGVPVIATNCGGVAEVMGTYGKLVDVDDIAALAAAMREIYDHQPQKNTLLEAREYIVQKFGKGAIATQWIELYHRLI